MIEVFLGRRTERNDRHFRKCPHSTSFDKSRKTRVAPKSYIAHFTALFCGLLFVLGQPRSRTQKIL